MKIAYVSYNQMHAIANGGVGRKIRTAVRTWIEEGHDARWFLTTSANEVNGENINVFRFGDGKRGIRREVDRSRQLRRMMDAVADFQPDVIYLRAGIYTFPLQRLFRIAPVVMELNTVDVNEYRLRGIFHYGIHLLTRDFIFRRASGFVAVSHEIAVHSSNTKYGKPIKVLGNAIDLGHYESLPAPEHDMPRLTYIGAPDTPWHGIDKLFWLADACPDFAFDLIGSGPEELKGQSFPKNVHLHGFVERSVYQEILAQADVGIGSLALHRINVNEIPPLKVREYLAFGIPVLLAYEDTDLLGTDFDFVLKIANTEDNLRENLDAIRQFVFRMQGKRVDRKLIAPLIDSQVKEQQRLAFMAQIALGGQKT